MLAALVGRLGLPTLGVLMFLAVLVAWAFCWVFRSDARPERVSRMLLAWRGNNACVRSTAQARPHCGRGAGPGCGTGERPGGYFILAPMSSDWAA